MKACSSLLILGFRDLRLIVILLDSSLGGLGRHGRAYPPRSAAYLPNRPVRCRNLRNMWRGRRRPSPDAPPCHVKAPKLPGLMKPGVPPALPGRQSNFENSGSIPPAVDLVLSKLIVERAPGCCSCFCFSPVAIRPLRGASNRKPPALPTALPEDPHLRPGVSTWPTHLP